MSANDPYLTLAIAYADRAHLHLGRIGWIGGRVLCGRVHLRVEPDILHAPAVEDAVDHDRQALDIGPLAGAAAAVENDRPHIVVGQLALDRPQDLLALGRVSLA